VLDYEKKGVDQNERTAIEALIKAARNIDPKITDQVALVVRAADEEDYVRIV
jgi:hypothetical protein